MDNSKFLMNVTGNSSIAQHWYQILSHLDIINRYKVKLFIELGTYMGGTLVHLLPNLILNDDFQYLGFENNVAVVNPKLIEFSKTNPRCQIILDDMFSPENIQRISGRVANTDDVVYIFCDGGDKPRELRTFSAFLKPGDIISVHDYTGGDTGEIKDIDLDRLGEAFEPLEGGWRKDELKLPTFIRR